MRSCLSRLKAIKAALGPTPEDPDEAWARLVVGRLSWAELDEARAGGPELAEAVIERASASFGYAIRAALQFRNLADLYRADPGHPKLISFLPSLAGRDFGGRQVSVEDGIHTVAWMAAGEKRLDPDTGRLDHPIDAAIAALRSIDAALAGGRLDAVNEWMLAHWAEKGAKS